MSFFPKFLGRLMSVCIKIAWNYKSTSCSCVPSCFCLVWWSRLAGKSAPNYEKWTFFSIFSRFGSSPQVFGQVKEWLVLDLHKIRFFFILWVRLAGRSVHSYEKWSFVNIVSRFCPFPQVFGHVNDWSILEVHEIIRVLHVVACSVVFVLFDDPD